MLKTKLLKILPYWLAFLVLAIGLQTPAFSFYRNKTAQTAQKRADVLVAPEVLGESTSLRGGAALQEKSPVERIKVPDTQSLSAKSFLVFDIESGQNLVEKNPDSQLAIASLTKLMTALVAYKLSDLNKNFTVSAGDVLETRPVLGLLPGDQVKALDVFNAMLVGSCNDAALALADYTRQSTDKSFVGLMNQQAKELGMGDSNFSNPLGFDSKYNYSTANDLKTLVTTTEQLSAFANLGRRTAYEFVGQLGKTYKATATNKLLESHADMQAIKTGFTENSGGAMATKVAIGKHQIVIIVLGSQDREADTLKLKDEISTSFNWN